MNAQIQPAKRTDVLARLNAMSLTEDGLRQAVRVGFEAGGTVTADHPVGFEGTTTWAEAVRALREWLLPQGFAREDRENVPLVVHPDRAFVLTVAPGNSATGTDATPSTRKSRGPATERAVHQNQVCFTATDHPAFALSPSDDHEVETWLLLHYVDGDKDEIRIELSLPTDITAGNITRWKERLILAPIAIDSDIGIEDEEEENEVGELDISVTRRK